jgi:hypothetical protein
LLNFGLETISHEALPYDLSNGQSVPLFFEVGEDEKALDIVDKISKRSLDMIDFYSKEGRPYDRDMMISIEMVKYFIPLLEERGYTEEATKLKSRLESLIGSESSSQPGILERK